MADIEGNHAANDCIPTPMIVGSPTHILGNDIDPNKPTYYVPSGVCGFAWINVRDGRSSFARWLKKNDLGRPDSYYGGVTIWVYKFGQSYEKKRAYAGAFSSVLNEAGIKAYSMSRLD
jgi:hypothetical protein